MAYDAVKMKDWQISEAAEENMPMPEEWKEKLGLEKDETTESSLNPSLPKFLIFLAKIMIKPQSSLERMSCPATCF